MTDLPPRCRFRWHGQEFSGDILYAASPERWRVRVDQSGPRFAAGSEVLVTQAEMIEMIADSDPEPERPMSYPGDDPDRALPDDEKPG